MPSKKKSKTAKILFPRTEEEFDNLVKAVVVKFKLPSEEHAAAVIANRIAHSAVDQATTTIEYLGHCVLRNIAYQIASMKSSRYMHKANIDQIEAAIAASPGDQQAIDALQKAITDGSEYAKSVAEKLGIPFTPASEKVTKLHVAELT